MIQSLNSKINLTVKATSFLGFSNYGKIIIGDKAIEFYNDRDPRKYIQIPWEEVDYVIASIMFKGKWIPRYAVQTKHNGTFTFASKEPKKVLRAMRNYIDPDKMVKALSFLQVLKRGFTKNK